jgi:arylsulfatase A-like enzyme
MPATPEMDRPDGACRDGLLRGDDPSERPNVIVIMADDLGYGDVGAYGADPAVLATPQIDRLAAGGLRFTSGYCSNSTCTPSRYALLTGRYAWRKSGTGIGGINTPLLIDPNRRTLADVFKSEGYSTAVIGKWHLGLGSGAPQWNGVLSPGPLELGFDYCFLLPNTNDRVPSVYVENHSVANLDPGDPITVSTSLIPNSNPYSGVPASGLTYTSSKGHNDTVYNGVGRIGYFSGGQAARWRDEDMADDFIAKALSWIDNHQDGPFFLYFAAQDCHVPRLPHERFQGTTALGWRGDAIAQFDWSVGAILDKLEALGIDDKTLVILCSDNGPVLDDGYNDDAVSTNTATGHQPSGIHRGGKYSVLEGGTRTPFITWWPGRIPAGQVSDEIVCSIDLVASLAALLRSGPPVPRRLSRQPQPAGTAARRDRHPRPDAPHPGQQHRIRTRLPRRLLEDCQYQPTLRPRERPLRKLQPCRQPSPTAHRPHRAQEPADGDGWHRADPLGHGHHRYGRAGLAGGCRPGIHRLHRFSRYRPGRSLLSRWRPIWRPPDTPTPR